MSFRICVIGCGSIALRYHGPALARYQTEHPEVELAACCDLDEGRAARFRERFGFGRHYTDGEAMLRVERADSVCLFVPEHLTCELGCRVLQLGVPLFTEKPPGRTVAEIDRLIAAADASGAPTGVALNRRYMPLLRELQRRIAGLPSGIQHLRYDLTRVGRTDGDFSLTAIHGIDTVRFLAGADYRQITFHYQTLPALGPAVANILLDCTLASGATAHLEFCPVAGVVVERATVHALDWTCFVHTPIWDAFDAPGRLYELRQGILVADETGLTISDGPAPFEAGGFYAEHASFLDSLRQGQQPAGDLRSARQSVAVMECLRERKSEYRQADR